MKTLYVVRHAKSDWAHADLKDFDRGLNARGQTDAPVMANGLKSRGAKVDYILASPAMRTLATSKVFADILGYPEDKIKTDRRLYNANVDMLLSVVHKVSDEFQSIMLVGHNPGVTEFVNALFGVMIDNIPTCGVVAGKLNVRSWSDLQWGTGKMEFFETPK